MSAISVEKMGTIDVGRQGENLARTIEFDVSSLLAKWPGAKITLLVKRKGDPEPYFAEAKVEGHILKWPITEVETAVAGDGKIEIQAILGEVIEKSVTATFRVSASLSGSASEELPEVRPSWVDEVLAAAGSGGGSGGAGEGAFIVTATRDEEGRLYADKTQDEIRAAVAAGELCFLVDDDGQVYSYEGDVYNGTLRETCPTFARPAGYVSSERITFHRRQVTSSKNVAGMSSTLPLPTEPHQQFVSNKNGYPQWEERTHYKETTTAEMVNLAATELFLEDEDGDGNVDGFYLLSPWTLNVVAGGSYTVVCNGTPYECVGVDIAAINPDSPAGSVVLGNLDAMGITGFEGSNTDAPFILMCITNETGSAMGGVYGALFYMEAVTSVTISVSGVQTVTTYKTIPEDYLPQNVRNATKQIKLTVDADGNVTSDTDFATAWAMTEAQLQAAITVEMLGMRFYGNDATYTSSPCKVTRVNNTAGWNWIQVAYTILMDWAEVGGQCETTRYIDWMNGEIILRNHVIYGLPDMYTHKTNMEKRACFMRCPPESDMWTYADDFEVMKDVGGTYVVNASMDSSQTISVVDGQLYEARVAFRAGCPVSLHLTDEDGSVYAIPAVRYPSDDGLEFALSPEKGVLWTVAWTGSGMTMTVS